jgi:transcriptional regulator with XRE-family HTH domain
MTPAATLLRYFRKIRGYPQKYGAYLLGHGQSYVSNIETGKRNLDWEKFKAKLISGYQLSNSEIDELNEAIKYSKHIITLSLTMPEEDFRLAHDFFENLEHLSQIQKNQIKFTLLRSEINQILSSGNMMARNAVLALRRKGNETIE